MNKLEDTIPPHPQCRCNLKAKCEKLEDTDKMPFGKYEGKFLQDVPASYFHWLWCNGKRDNKQCPVADYIRRNLNVLKLEYSDGIW